MRLLSIVLLSGWVLLGCVDLGAQAQKNVDGCLEVLQECSDALSNCACLLQHISKNEDPIVCDVEDKTK